MLRIFVAACMLCGSLVNAICFQTTCYLDPFSDDFCCDTGSCCTELEYNAENVDDTITDFFSCTTTTCQLNPFTENFCCDDGSCCTESQYDAENVDDTITDLLSCTTITCQVNPFTEDFCCDDGSCCTESQYDAENVDDTITDLFSCTTTTCQLNPFTDDFCCDDGSCCTETQYDAENLINVATDTLSSGALIGICAGASVFVIICVVIGVCVFCNSHTTNQGTVVHNGTVSAQTQAMQQDPLGHPPLQTYPPIGYKPTIKPYSIPNQTIEQTF